MGTPTPAGRRRRSCWPSTRRRAARSGRAGLHGADGALMPRLRAERGEAGIVQRRVGRSHAVRVPTEGRALLEAMTTDLAAAPCDGRARSRDVSPVAVVTGAARGIGAATVDRWWPAVAGGGGRHLRRRSRARLRLGHAGGPRGAGRRHGDKVRTVVGDVRSPADMRAAVDEAVASFGGLEPRCRVAGVISGGPPLWETGDAQWESLRRERRRRAEPGPGGRPGVARGPGAPPGTGGGGGLGRGYARAAPA